MTRHNCALLKATSPITVAKKFKELGLSTTKTTFGGHEYEEKTNEDEKKTNKTMHKTNENRLKKRSKERVNNKERMF